GWRRIMPKSLLEEFDIPEHRIRTILSEAVAGADDGELFVEYREGEALVFDNGRLKTASFSTDQGFGLRVVAGEAAGFAHASQLDESALLRAAKAASAVGDGYRGELADN